MKKVSIKDVAEKAGVSVATVSYVMNGLNKVKKETADKVLNAIKELNYKPSLTATSLANGESKLICVILPLLKSEDHIGRILNHNPFYAEFVSDLMSTLEKNGYDVTISGAFGDLDLENKTTYRKVDGYIIFGDKFERLAKDLYENNTPAVLVDVDYTSPLPSVSLDEEIATYIATKHLIDYNHRDIGFVCSDLSLSTINKRRFEGYKRALDESNIPLYKGNVFECNAGFEEGCHLADKIMKERYDLSALVCTSDIIAIGIENEYLSCGRRIPEDLSIVGFDNINTSTYIYPRLTTIDQKIEEKASLVSKILINQLKGVKSNMHIVLEPELVIRGSTKKRIVR